jgi:hypothetical protein
MTLTSSRSSLDAPRSSRRPRGPAHADRSHLGGDRTRRKYAHVHERPTLGRYTDSDGHPREVIVRPGSAGSVLVLDRDAATLADRRLVAHLGADEPPENAAVMCDCYLQHVRHDGYRCRLVTPEDFRNPPFVEGVEMDLDGQPSTGVDDPIDGLGRAYRLERLPTGMSIPELRWRRWPSGPAHDEPQTISVREAIAALESYEPVRGLTSRTLARCNDDNAVSIAVLRAELARLRESPIVLNRGLREAVVAAMDRHGLSMSEIAIRCGRIKHDRAGNESGETSWLARRLGLLPEGGHATPTPWIHSDVLALIARHGLGISPREAELD